MRVAVRRLAVALIAGPVFAAIALGSAPASTEPPCSTWLDGVEQTIRAGAGCGGSGGGNPADNSGGHRTPPTGSTPPRKSAYELKVEAWERRVATIRERNLTSAAAWDRCVNSSGAYACGQYLAGIQALPGRPTPPTPGEGDATPAVPAIPPEVVAYQAVAELKLTAPKPLIGPDPSLNKWNTAAVGYPLWLAVDGDTTPAPVADSVYDVSVSLRARLSKVVFVMGDGHRVTCTGSEVTHPWTPAVATSAPSPWCGYTYTSVPKGSRTYTVTANAYWSVDWQINGTTGTLPFYQSASVQLPVSELQVLVR